jgi:hypothetical protein
MPLTGSWSLPAPLKALVLEISEGVVPNKHTCLVIQRQLMALQLQKKSRVWTMSGFWLPDPEMKAALLAKVTEPSCVTKTY